jgi:uncharacterized membrane protein
LLPSRFFTIAQNDKAKAFLLFTFMLDNKKAFSFIKSITMITEKTWLDKHRESLTYGQRIADSVANGMGSWAFIIGQTIFVVIWMTLNVIGFIRHWDVYPFILLNLIFSTQAAYAAPIIMMAQNRQSERDRLQAQEDYKTNIEAKQEIESLQIQLDKIEIEKLDKIIIMLEKLQRN